MSSGWAWEHFGCPDGCPEACLCIPVTYLRHTLGDPRIQPYHNSCDPGSTCGLPRVHYSGIRSTQLYFTKADIHGIPMAHPEHTHVIPAAHPEYALGTPISCTKPLAHRTNTLKIPKTTVVYIQLIPVIPTIHSCCSLEM